STRLSTANGMSGYMPAHYPPLQLGLEERDESVLDALGTHGPVLVAVEQKSPGANDTLSWLRDMSSARPIVQTDETSWFVVSATPARPICATRHLPVRALRNASGPLSDRALLDGNPDTQWLGGGAQRAGDFLVLDLGGVQRPCSIRMSIGRFVASYPRALSVASSLDGMSWTTSFNGKLGGAALMAAIDRPLDPVIELPVREEPARFVRIQLESDQPKMAWILTDVAVTASREE